ncbi:hypothetical protein BCS42_01225 [Crenothrix sp. D3]|nr:hypothetical protein BCS42_01225 [Crenothrix sp. D3]
MIIKNQTIHGGTQQFADSIINQYYNAKFDQHDIELLKFIAELKIAESVKQTTGNDIAIINDQSISLEARKNAQHRIRELLLHQKDAISVWIKRISKVVVTSILAKYDLNLKDIDLNRVE